MTERKLCEREVEAAAAALRNLAVYRGLRLDNADAKNAARAALRAAEQVRVHGERAPHCPVCGGHHNVGNPCAGNS